MQEPDSQVRVLVIQCRRCSELPLAPGACGRGIFAEVEEKLFSIQEYCGSGISEEKHTCKVTFSGSADLQGTALFISFNSHRAVYFVEDVYQLSDNHTPSRMQEGRTVRAVKEAVNETVHPESYCQMTCFLQAESETGRIFSVQLLKTCQEVQLVSVPLHSYLEMKQVSDHFIYSEYIALGLQSKLLAKIVLAILFSDVFCCRLHLESRRRELSLLHTELGERNQDDGNSYSRENWPLKAEDCLEPKAIQPGKANHSSDLSDLETFSKYLSPLPYSPNDFSRHPGLSVMLKLSNFSVPTILVQKEGKPVVRLEKPQEGQKPNQKVQETVRQNKTELRRWKTECVNEAIGERHS
ncbi:hypothetical protein Anapl_04159 [Anas platyrhynchos]|uniref:Uncharacterized protein n=1 Tax=Anas platyrhynchos TaxID=8839 RepID=R0LSY0_ANAPL|nr:hypothetical protein Anapl_04159 [Anas platyrhynchos]